MKIEEAVEKYPNLLIGKAFCMYCDNAVNLLSHEYVDYMYLSSKTHSDLVQEVKNKYNHNTYPMIFIDKKFIGGCSELRKYLKEKGNNNN
ncbi:hypothetical protein EDEG_02094 [Edhazardia aedis USNM 41457]|uniref:Glutaredoxin domain-containing protein n=1 Tax=Edhazardia aedis (strain USNM 41457) TaxID=1003232 RepID=J9DQK0_EDHAE|nr:hypothetical protein EDEG_02094 [Edhazardia aedis USNM 41457]|eukprot:EJW03582.1 hypothetical protein EDEG_02094 [Edhazardia aedis USNM 41457]